MSIERSDIGVRPANWLPLPCDVIVEDGPSVEEDDLFPKGEVMTYHPKQGYGVIKDVRGDLINFRVDELDLVGPKGDSKYLAIGKRVGYDVGRTSTGIHVTKVKIY